MSSGPATLQANRNFRLLWAGEGISVLGSMTTSIVFPLLAVTEFDAGPLAMGVLAGAILLPWLVIGLPAGAWVDRSDPRTVMMRADVVAAVVAAGIPLSWALGHLTLAQVIVTALALGVTNVFFRTGYTALVPRVVRSADLDQANSRIYGTESSMQALGPAVGGSLVQAIGAAVAILFDVLTIVTSWLCLSRMKTTQFTEVAPPRDTQPLRHQILEGVRIVAADRFLRFFTLQGAFSNFAITGYAALLVLFLVRDLDLAPSQTGIVMALGFCGGAIGSLLATPATRRWGDAGALRSMQILAAPGPALIALAFPGAGVALVPLGMFLLAVGVVGANVVRASFRARYTPAELMGRVSSTSAVLNFGTMPLAGLVGGALGASLGVRPTIALMAALNAAACLTVLIGPFRRGRDLPTSHLSPAASTSAPA